LGRNTPIDPVWERRLAKLESFQGDHVMGFAKPASAAVISVRKVLSEIYRRRPDLPAPAISPAADGEILVSWRGKNAYFILSFEDGATFDWLGSLSRPVSGTLDTKIRYGSLASIIAGVVGVRAPPSMIEKRALIRHS
jgi:hypothetical protein